MKERPILYSSEDTTFKGASIILYEDTIGLHEDWMQRLNQTGLIYLMIRHDDEGKKPHYHILFFKRDGKQISYRETHGAVSWLYEYAGSRMIIERKSRGEEVPIKDLKYMPKWTTRVYEKWATLKEQTEAVVYQCPREIINVSGAIDYLMHVSETGSEGKKKYKWEDVVTNASEKEIQELKERKTKTEQAEELDELIYKLFDIIEERNVFFYTEVEAICREQKEFRPLLQNVQSLRRIESYIRAKEYHDRTTLHRIAVRENEDAKAYEERRIKNKERREKIAKQVEEQVLSMEKEKENIDSFYAVMDRAATKAALPGMIETLFKKAEQAGVSAEDVRNIMIDKGYGVPIKFSNKDSVEPVDASFFENIPAFGK